MVTPYLHESFAGPGLHPRLRWHRPPARWAIDPGRFLRIEPEPATDFWQRTHYGFAVDNGHFLCTELNGDFVLTVHVRFRPVHQYDQAGLMVHSCADVAELCSQIQTGAGAALLAEESLDPATLRALVAVLHRQDVWSDFPLVVFFSSVGPAPRTSAKTISVETSAPPKAPAETSQPTDPTSNMASAPTAAPPETPST